VCLKVNRNSLAIGVIVCHHKVGKFCNYFSKIFAPLRDFRTRTYLELTRANLTQSLGL